MASVSTYKKAHPPKPMLENDSGKPHQGVYLPKHPEKVVGGDIIYRSGWELAFARWCDDNPAVIEWGGEPIAIQYRNPASIDFEACRAAHCDPLLEQNWAVSQYWPDFYLCLRAADDTDATNVKKYIIEIKPKYQTERPIAPPPGAKLKDQKAYVNAVKTYLQNMKKWEAAIEWCASHGFEFKVYTEVTLEKMGII